MTSPQPTPPSPPHALPPAAPPHALLALACHAAWGLLLAALLYQVTAHTWSYSKRDYRLVDDPPFAGMRPELIDVLTLGHRGLYDDLLSIWSIQMLIDQRTNLQDPAALQRSVLQLTRQQPRVESVYMLSCFVLALDLGRPEACEPVTIDGLKALPDSWRIPVTQGFISAYKLQDRAKAALYYSVAASRPEAPEFLRQLAANLARKEDLSPSDLEGTLRQILQGRTDSRLRSFLETSRQQPPPRGP